ncbi:FHA domain-containing protein [Nymphaea thermarum]|nr:FHA domain-containing protein [Nymphaea thermarum]
MGEVVRGWRAATNAAKAEPRKDSVDGRYRRLPTTTWYSRETYDDSFQTAEEQDIVLGIYERGKHLHNVALWRGAEMGKGPRNESLIAGRNLDCDRVFRHPSIHGSHFEIGIDKVRRKMWVTNTTQNGRLSVSKEVIVPKQTMQIYPGDILKIGNLSRDYKLELITPEQQEVEPYHRQEVLNEGCTEGGSDKCQNPTPPRMVESHAEGSNQGRNQQPTENYEESGLMLSEVILTTKDCRRRLTKLPRGSQHDQAWSRKAEDMRPRPTTHGKLGAC